MKGEIFDELQFRELPSLCSLSEGSFSILLQLLPIKTNHVRKRGKFNQQFPTVVALRYLHIRIYIWIRDNSRFFHNVANSIMISTWTEKYQSRFFCISIIHAYTHAQARTHI